MKVIRNILLIALALLFQSTFMGRFDIYGIRPDFAMLVLLFIVSFSSPVESIFYGFLIGFLQDIYTPEYLGFNSLTMSLMGFALAFVKERFTVEKGLVHFIVTLFACLVHDGIYMTLYTHFDFSSVGSLFLRANLPGAVYTSLVSLVVIIVWNWAEKGGLLVVFRQLMGYRQ